MSENTTVAQKDLANDRPESTRGGVFFTPRVDIYETGDELVLCADLPGVRSEDVDLRYEKDELILHGRVQPRHADVPYSGQEYEIGDFYRSFTVHEFIDPSRIQAECKNGVLTVHLPKAEAVRPKQIRVRGQ